MQIIVIVNFLFSSCNYIKRYCIANTQKEKYGRKVTASFFHTLHFFANFAKLKVTKKNWSKRNDKRLNNSCPCQ